MSDVENHVDNHEKTKIFLASEDLQECISVMRDLWGVVELESLALQAIQASLLRKYEVCLA